MKILIPFCQLDEHNLDSSHVSGGVERFIQLIYQEFPAEILPFYYTREETRKRVVKDKLIMVINSEKPDIVIVNYDSATLIQAIQKMEVPTLWISHTAAGGISKIGHVKMMLEFLKLGGTLAMVSPWQYEGMRKLSNRINGVDLDLNGGFINPAFCKGDEVVKEQKEHDVVTIARMCKVKNPFLNHRFSEKVYRSLILSTTSNLHASSNVEYYEKNKHWTSPQETLLNLSHKEIMNKLSSSKIYFSTCPVETWGITVLEALSRGLPVILMSKNSHASEIIPASENHFLKVSTKKEFDLAVEKFLHLSHEERLQISEDTKRKHSKENWIANLDKIIRETVARKKEHKKNCLF